MKLKTKTVSEVNKYISLRLENDVILQHLAIKGEISNLSGRDSGHVYFNLIDGNTQISCVMFKSIADNFRDKLVEGSSLIVFGKVQVYEKQGKYQINVSNIVEDEASYLNKLFLELKEKLLKLGYFDNTRKRKLPEKIYKIGLICSKTSAAIIDFLTILESRHPLLEIILIDVHVQGDQASKEVSSAIRQLQSIELLDLIVVTRGGGSAEDLFIFNDEEISKAAFESKIPVLSAIGHERDTCLLDLTADIVAGTPSIAAQMISENFFSSVREISYTLEKINDLIRSRFKYERLKLESDSNSLIENSSRIFEYRKLEIKNLLDNIQSCLENRFSSSKADLDNKLKLLKSYDITNILERGFSILMKQNKPLKNPEILNKGDIIEIQTLNFLIDAEVKKIKAIKK